MDLTRRTELLEAKKAELLGSLEAHVHSLETLDAETTFDFDIATDLHHELIDNTTRDGRERLEFWQEIYSGLAALPRYMVEVRYSVGLKPGCYGFGQEESYEIKHAWVRVFKDPTPDSVIFGRDANGGAEVSIAHPSTLFSSNSAPVEEASSPLMTEAGQRIEVWGGLSNPLQHEPKIYFYNDLIKLMTGANDFTFDKKMRAYLPTDIGPFIEAEKKIDPQFVAFRTKHEEEAASLTI